MSANIVREKGLDLVDKIMTLCSAMEGDPLMPELSRSGLSILSNIHEADRAQSKADLIQKLGNLHSEINKFLFYLGVLNVTKNISEQEFESINTAVTEVSGIITSSIETAKLTDN